MSEQLHWMLQFIGRPRESRPDKAGPEIVSLTGNMYLSKLKIWHLRRRGQFSFQLVSAGDLLRKQLRETFNHLGTYRVCTYAAVA